MGVMGWCWHWASQCGCSGVAIVVWLLSCVIVWSICSLVAMSLSVMWHLEYMLAKGNNGRRLTVHSDNIVCFHCQMTPCCQCCVSLGELCG